MNTLPLDLYKIIAFGLGNDSWQSFVDHYAEKYNVAQIDGFDFAPVSLNYTFQQMIAETGAYALPAYVDPESPGYESALREVQGITGNIPTMKKYYRLNRTIVSERLQLLQRVGQAGLTPEMQNIFMSLIDEGTDGLIGSFMNALTNQRMQIASTGKFTINATNNPRGLQGITINFLKSGHEFTANTTTARWWTNTARTTEGSASDPISDIKKAVRSIRNDFHYVGALHVEINKNVYDDLLQHSAVLTRIGHSLYPNVTDDATVKANAQNYSDEALGQYLSRLCGVEVRPIDAIAYVDSVDASNKDIATTAIQSFSEQNIAFVPDGIWGSIQGCSPLTLGYDADKVASFHDGRLVLTQRANPKTHSIYIESEAAQLCVPTNTNGHFIKTVTA